jgi:hypothetical protein
MFRPISRLLMAIKRPGRAGGFRREDMTGSSATPPIDIG